jgi:hypothetical protein
LPAIEPSDTTSSGRPFSAASVRTRFDVLDGSTPDGFASWLSLWKSWPDCEIMAHPDYARLFAEPGQRFICVTATSPHGAILFPLILRPLAAEPWAQPGETRWDATTPYGYGGPFTWANGPIDYDAFWAAYDSFCRQSQIVSTFARLSLFPGQLAPIPGSLEFRLPNIVVPLDGGPDAIWAGYEGKVRKWVRVAQESGVTVECDPTGARLDDFRAIYIRTMSRRHATEWYYFSRDFFQSIVDNLPGQFMFFHALRNGAVISSDLVLCSRDHVYYFLGGTLEEAFPFGANYLVKHTIALWACAHGKQSCVLGGGYELGDTLFRYKRAYARKGEVPFHTANLIHDEAACHDLTAIRSTAEQQSGTPWTPRPGFFPPYRA